MVRVALRRDGVATWGIEELVMEARRRDGVVAARGLEELPSTLLISSVATVLLLEETEWPPDERCLLRGKSENWEVNGGDEDDNCDAEFCMAQ